MGNDARGSRIAAGVKLDCKKCEGGEWVIIEITSKGALV